MTVKNFVSNYDLEIGFPFIIRSFNDDTGEEKVVYKSWEDYDVPESIMDEEVHYISVGEFEYVDCIVIEYTTWGEE